MSSNESNRPNLSEDEIDDLLYFARTGDTEEFGSLWKELCEREKKAVEGTGQELDLGDLLEVARDEESGNGVLHMAAGNGHLTFLKTTIKSLNTTKPQNNQMLKVINAQNKAGNTPLHWAAVNGHLECVKMLMEGGGDPTVRNNVGHDAIYEAEINGKGEVVEWALKEGGEGIEEGVAGEVGEGGGEGEVEGDGEGEGDEEMEVDGDGFGLEGEVGSGDVESKLEELSVGEGDEKGKGKA